jgi:hypothetical protein
MSSEMKYKEGYSECFKRSTMTDSPLLLDKHSSVNPITTGNVAGNVTCNATNLAGEVSYDWGEQFNKLRGKSEAIALMATVDSKTSEVPNIEQVKVNLCTEECFNKVQRYRIHNETLINEIAIVREKFNKIKENEKNLKDKLKATKENLEEVTRKWGDCSADCTFYLDKIDELKKDNAKLKELYEQKFVPETRINFNKNIHEMLCNKAFEKSNGTAGLGSNEFDTNYYRKFYTKDEIQNHDEKCVKIGPPEDFAKAFTDEEFTISTNSFTIDPQESENFENKNEEFTANPKPVIVETEVCLDDAGQGNGSVGETVSESGGGKEDVDAGKCEKAKVEEKTVGVEEEVLNLHFR